MPALKIRDDISSEGLRRQARRKNDGRVSARLIAIANALDGMDRARAARWRGWIGRPCATGCTATTPRGSPVCATGRSRGAYPSSAKVRASLKAIVLAGPDPAVDQVVLAKPSICAAMSKVRALGRQLQRDRHALSPRLLWSLDLSHRKTRARHPQSDEKAQQAFKKGGFAACLNEIAEAYPEAERLEIWSQDEARGRAERAHRLCLVAARPHAARASRYRLPVGLDYRRGLPGARHRGSAGADPARHRSNEPISRRAVLGCRARGAWCGADGQGGLAHRRRSGGARQPQPRLSAALLARTSTRSSGCGCIFGDNRLSHRLWHHRRNHRQLLRRLELAARRDRPHPFATPHPWLQRVAN